jgi:chromosome segregation protein
MSLALTRIRLHGFKTFAQRVEIELASNLTAIVGPNGCGKSNLVDALIWALGEANVRTLRAQTPTEVLFSGSAVHKPLGLAEVALWFNNESRWLPLEVDEVQITRRLYRSGEWECWINRTPARLRDLSDLFAGTGLGRGGYAIVGQGDIDALLNAPPDERRRWLEEVAGVALYRTRRKDALRDLESARLHLTRVDDVLRELERQREPLRHEAERALVYRELRRQLQQLERAYLQYEYLALQQRMQQAREERNALRECIVQTELAIAKQEAHAETYGQAIAQLESEMDTLRTVLQSQLTAEERTLGELSRLDERERALHELARTLHEESESLQAQEAERQHRITELQAELHAIETEAQSLAPTIPQTEAAVKDLETQRRALEAAYQSTLRQHSERESARQHAERLRSEAVQTETRLSELREESERFHAELQILQTQENELQSAADALESEQAHSERELQRLTREAQGHTRTVETLRARARALESSLLAGEGASPAVRALLQAVRKGELQGEFVPVGAAITVSETYQTAISAALGGAVNDILTPTEAEARAAVEWLKRNRTGRLTFLPLDLISGTDSPVRATETHNTDKNVRATETHNTDKNVRATETHSTDKNVCATETHSTDTNVRATETHNTDTNVRATETHNTDTNVRATETHSTDTNVRATETHNTDTNVRATETHSTDKNVCATETHSTDKNVCATETHSTDKNVCATEGVLGVAADLVQYDPRYAPAIRYLLGRVLVVDTLENATALVRELRRRQRTGEFSRIATLDGAVVQLSGAITGGAYANERSSLLQLKAELERARTELHTAETHLHEAEATLEAHRTAHFERQHRLEALRRQLREVAQQRLRTENDYKQRTREIQHYGAQLQRTQQQLNQIDALLQQRPDTDLSALEAERERLQGEYDTLTRALAQHRAQISQLESRRREAQRQIETEQRALSQLRERQQSRQARLQNLQQERAQIESQRAAAHAELERIRIQITHAQSELDARRAERERLLEQSFAVNDRIRTLRAELSQHAERERTLDLQIARGEVKLAEIEDHWRQIAPDEPLPETGVPLPAKPPVARAELERVRRALAELGEVNPAAADEYTRLNERFTHLERQRADLEQTCAQLEQQLREIDAHAREQFLKTFESVRGAFKMRFQQLFEGGQAELILTDERDPLSAGVIVEAQPPGKRRQRLELLSGGERALTAIALLFAFSTVKPSPLMVLDEVDAALDGRNVQRFADYLKQMAESSQILIVTHNPITTAVARQWLGVSMTSGVSRIVPYTPPESLLEADGVERSRAIIQTASETAPQP